MAKRVQWSYVSKLLKTCTCPMKFVFQKLKKLTTVHHRRRRLRLTLKLDRSSFELGNVIREEKHPLSVPYRANRCFFSKMSPIFCKMTLNGPQKRLYFQVAQFWPKLKHPWSKNYPVWAENSGTNDSKK